MSLSATLTPKTLAIRFWFSLMDSVISSPSQNNAVQFCPRHARHNNTDCLLHYYRDKTVVKVLVGRFNTLILEICDYQFVRKILSEKS
jgi:hypothetical protein